MPTDIDIDRMSSDEPKLLLVYIDFAINGAESLKREVTELDVTEYDSRLKKFRFISFWTEKAIKWLRVDALVIE